MSLSKTVLCSGCFDPLHVGHIRHLREARYLGDRLVVSVTGDKWIAKGRGRPAFSQGLRAEAVRALRCVDEVIINEAADTVGVIERIRPAIYAKGQDYVSFRNEALQRERAAVERVGGEVVFIGGRIASSTEMLKDAGTLLYIRGEPGSGKITVARVLEQRLGWRLFWLHDLDGICKIVGGNKIPRLMDDITKPILSYLLQEYKNLIYVRPSRDGETVLEARALAASMGLKTVVVRLEAPWEELALRVSRRDGSDFRLSSGDELFEYLSARPQCDVEGEHVLSTYNVTPESVADKIAGLL